MHGLKRHSFVGQDKTVYQRWKQKYDKGMKPTINNLVAMAHVADVQRSADFYSQMGLRIVNTFKNDAGVLCWVDLRSGDAALMPAKANVPVIAGEQAVLFCTPTTWSLCANSFLGVALLYPRFRIPLTWRKAKFA
jgi:hypothetical protein